MRVISCMLPASGLTIGLRPGVGDPAAVPHQVHGAQVDARYVPEHKPCGGSLLESTMTWPPLTVRRLREPCKMPAHPDEGRTPPAERRGGQ